MIDEIKSFEQVDELYKNGVNICVGCKFEHFASCNADRIGYCNEQLEQIRKHKTR